MTAYLLWENRKVIAKVIAAIAFLFFLPILYIMMLPPLVFGNDGMDAVSEDVLTNPSVISSNMTEAEAAISSLLSEAHDGIISDIEKEAENLGEYEEYSILDAFANQIIFESTSVISQFCASEKDFQEINLTKLKQVLKQHEKDFFDYSVSTSSYEKPDEKTQKNVLITHYHYTVEYVGSDYFADTIFELTDEERTIAKEYAANLDLFLKESQ